MISGVGFLCCGYTIDAFGVGNSGNGMSLWVFYRAHPFIKKNEVAGFIESAD